jgi:ubiquinone/menaquinone biosynthesis C-methylase UbiE
MPEETAIIGNYYNKYKTKNPIERFLLNNYEKTLKRIIKSLSIKKIYEVGSGEGVILNWLSDVKPEAKLYGSDISPIFDLSIFVERPTKPIFLINDAENLPFSHKPFDLIIACEVLEHLTNPGKCLEEFQRLNAQYYILTVPNDKLWKILNMLRLKYVRDLGNTPGHKNHWSRSSFCKLVSNYLNIQYSVYVQPWIFVLATGKNGD